MRFRDIKTGAIFEAIFRRCDEGDGGDEDTASLHAFHASAYRVFNSDGAHSIETPGGFMYIAGYCYNDLCSLLAGREPDCCGTERISTWNG